MRMASIAAPLCLAAGLAFADQPPAAPAALQQEIEALQVELIAALRSGDRPALERLLADGFTFVHATGGLDTKREHVDGNPTHAVWRRDGKEVWRAARSKAIVRAAAALERGAP